MVTEKKKAVAKLEANPEKISKDEKVKKKSKLGKIVVATQVAATAGAFVKRNAIATYAGGRLQDEGVMAIRDMFGKGAANAYSIYTNALIANPGLVVGGTLLVADGLFLGGKAIYNLIRKKKEGRMVDKVNNPPKQLKIAQ